VVLYGALLGPALGLGVVAAQPGGAAPTPDDTQELRIIERTEQGEDPLGIDRATGSELDEAALLLPRAAPVPPPSAVSGAVLSSLSQVRETNHRVLVKFEQGLAFVQVNLGFESRASFAAEIAYRLAVPEGAVPFAATLCAAQGGPCVSAGPSESESAADAGRSSASLPSWFDLAPIHDRTGAALALKFGPIQPAQRLELELQYVVAAPLRGGHVQLHLPARGEDPKIAPKAKIRLRAPGFLPFEVPDEFDWEASLPLDLRAEWPEGAPGPVVDVRVRCGAGWCSRRHQLAGATPTAVRPTWLWIDASPSMEGPARGRVDVTLAALLARLPGQTPLRAHAFAARAEPLGEFSAEAAPLLALSDATMLDLDAGTRPSSVFALSRDELIKQRPRILILSDGLLERSAEERRAWQRAQEHGAELWLLAVGDRPPEPPTRDAQVTWLADEADRALKQGDFSALSDALGAAMSEQLLPGLRAGEQRVEEHRPDKPYRLEPRGPWLSYWMAREEAPLHLRLGANRPYTSVVAAIPFTDAPAPAPFAYTAMPAESVLEMLRTQLVPKARACLRSDRRGRGDYAVALSFRAFFSHREVSEASIEGDVPEPLRECLMALLPKLRVPAFSGGVRVRYPIHTDREAGTPVIELTPEISESVRRVLTAPLRRP